MSSSSSSSSILTKKYDVFLSFRGETRTNFTDHLYKSLRNSGIYTFRDKERLDVGKKIAPELSKAIQQSQCFVIILSENYASSGWCLEELAEIVKLKEEQEGLEVIPIFYHVDPSDFRRQKGKVGEAIAKHEQRYNEDTIQRWCNALTQVANLTAWVLGKDQYETDFIKGIVKAISEKLHHPIDHDDGLVGIDSRLEVLRSNIEIGEDDVRIIGICGMGGIGKTTLAEVAYNEMSCFFEGKCFIYDVRDKSDTLDEHVSLQGKLLSDIVRKEFRDFSNVIGGKTVIRQCLSSKKVLIVLDNVDKDQQLEYLVGSRDWFGPGSRIIVTTRDEGLLLSHRVYHVYKAETLNNDDALRLFLSKAFNGGTAPNSDLKRLSRCVVGYAGGLPLALKLWGSLFGGIDAAQWENAIERLARESDNDIVDKLRISFDVLKQSTKDIFLDLACFFYKCYKYTKDFVMEILDGCKFFPGIGIDDLVKKSLVTIEKDRYEEIEEYGGIYIRMHDLLREMGRKIIRDESKEPGKRSRLWDLTDVKYVVTQNTATDAIECMHVDFSKR